MALSQIQCLDDNNVNQRIYESKPEFFYCEEQRLALEALLRDGREAFAKYLESRGLRGFLSDLEQETLAAALEPFDPDAELFYGEREGEPEPLSLQYWPDVSDTSIPQMDLGWPDSESYRGVTRTTVYTQPPMEGQPHIKEVVRKMIAQAQKVIAVVMDVFTDVDIFRDLLDAGFKRKVSVYILLERTMLPHFLSMCRRANMHPGHLKHLRVRCTEGSEFYTRYCTRIKGQLGHRFMFIDGDKAVSGSYSFTWMSSRLDRNLITVTTGQAVDAFDQVFRYLYVTSSFVDLRQVTTDPEPEPDTRHQVLSVAPPSAAVARKLYNPKYALVALSSPSPVNSNSNVGPKEPEVSEEPKNKKKQKRTREDPPQDAPSIHPGLLGLEKACLLSYLPTWPEPDPPSDVIGFINIRDSKKPTQVHLQRSEMFEISQAIKFSSPISKPQETLPEVAKPRNRNAQSEFKTDGLLVDKAKPEKKSVGLTDNNNEEMAPEKNSPLHRQKLNFDKSESQILQKQKKLCSGSDSGPVSLIPQALPQSSIKALTPKNEQPSHKAQITSTTSSLSESLKESKCVKEPEIATVSQTQSTFVDGTKTLKSNTAQKSQLHNQNQLNTEEHNIVSHQESHTNAANTQLKISSEETCDLQNTDSPRHIETSSACPKQSESLLSKNTLVTITTVASTTATSSCNSTPSTSLPLTLPPSTSSFPKLPLLPSSASSFTSSDTPDSKLCSEQLLKQDSVNSNTETTPDIVVVEKSKTSLGPQIITDASALTSLVQTSPVKNLESGPDLHRNSVSKTGHPKQTENTNIPQDTKQETQTSKNASNQESHGYTADTQHKVSSEETCNLQNVGRPGHIATSSASPAQSESPLSKHFVTITAVPSTTGTSSCNSAHSTSSLSTNSPSTFFPELPLLPSSTSSFTSSVAPDSMPCSDQLLKQGRVNDSTETNPGSSVDKRSKTSSGSQIITDASALTSLVQTSPVKNLESGPDMQRNSVSKTKYPKQTENTNIPQDTKQETQTVTSQNVSNQESHCNDADTQLKISTVETRSIQNPGSPGYIVTSSASPAQSQSSLSKNNLVTITAVASTTATGSCNSAPSTNSLSTNPPSTSFPELPLLPSSASSSTSSVAPDSKPCSDQLFKQDRVNDSTETTPGISVDNRSKTSTGPQIITDVSSLTSLVQTSPVKNLETGPDLQRNSVSKTGRPKQTENTNIPGDAKQETQAVNSQNASNQESHSNTADTQLKISSDKTCNPPNPGSLGYIATSSASPIQSESSLSKNNLVTITAVASTTGTSSCNSTPSTNSLLTDPPSTSSFPELPLLPSSASSFTSSVAPDSKPCSDQLFKQDRVNDSTETTPGISVDKRCKTSLGPQIINDVSALTSLVQTSPVNNLESGPDLRGSSVSKTKYPKQTENTNIPEDTKQETQTVTSQKRKGKETDRKHNDRAEVHSVTENQLETKSDVSAKDSSSTAIVNINELIPKSVDSKTHRYCIATSSNSISDKTLTNLECAKATNTQTYLARCHEPQIISYSNFTIDDINKAQPLETSTAPTNWISHNTYILKENHDGSINSAANALSQPGKQAQVPSVDGTIITLNSVKQHTHNTFLEQACITQGGAYTSRKTLNLPFSNVQAMDFTLQTNKQESQLPAADVQSSAPKVSPPNLPTTDSQTTSPDLQTPTTDISDDYLSSREDSTTSEEYFECSESPSHEPVLDTSGCCSYGTGKNSSPTNSACHFSRNVGTSSADLDNISSVSGLTNSSHSTSSSESSILSWTSREPPTSLLGTKGQNRESNITTRRNSKEGAKNEVSSSNTEKKKEQVHQSMEGTNSKELNRMPRSLKRESDLKEMALKLSKASGGQVEGATTDGESVQKETKRLSTGELKPERVLSEGKKSLSSKDKPTNEAALTPGHMEIRQRQSTRETTGQKPLNPSPKSQPRQQPGSRGSSPSRPLSSTRGSQAQAPRPSGIRDLSQPESRALQSNVKEFVYKPPPRRSQSRSPSPMKAAPTGSAAGRKQVSQSQLLTWQPPAAQTRSKFDPPQIKAAKQQASTLHTLSSLQPQAHPLASSQEVSEQAAQETEEARVPFNLSLSRLYNFKGLRDKWTKLPTQSRRSRTGTPVKERKSTS